MRPILLLPCLALLLTPLAGARAEVVLDGTVGSRGKLTLNGQDVRITPDMGSTRGSNLFHSFEKFGVPSGDAVTFEGPAGTANIIGRVTGPDGSQIHGTLRSTALGAGLWLLNPNGIVVGKGAAIDVPGSLHLSTADELRFEDGAKFSARDIQGSQLTAAAPEAFGFLGGPIGELKVEAPELDRGNIGFLTTTSLTGGSVTIDGTLLVTDGPLLIAGQAGPGEVRLDQAHAVARDGNVRIEGGAELVAWLFFPEEVLRVEGGNVTIQAANLTAFSFSSIGQASAPAVAIAGQSVRVDGGGNLSFGQIATRATGTDRAPSIIITADDILLQRAAAYSLVSETGPSGEVVLKGERITLANGTVVGSPSSGTGTPGKGGRTFVVADDRLVLRDGAQILSFTEGLADAGDIVLRVGALDVTDGSIATSSNAGTGRAGQIDIVARGKASIGGSSTLGAFTITQAPSGSIRIVADEVDLSGRTRVTTSTEASGNAGNISISGDKVVFRDTTLVDSTSRGGTGSAGEITIASTTEARLDGGAVSTIADPGSGGRILLLVGDRLILENGGAIGSRIEGNIQGAQAGSVTIQGIDGGDGGPVVLDASSFIIADAPNVGDGGTIRIATDGLIARPGQIDASARQGNAGTVATTSPQTDIVSSFAGLDAQVAPADRLLATSCDAREIASSLVVGAVRGGEDAFDPRRPFGSQAQAEGCAR